MKKLSFKRIMALVLSLVMILSATACSGGSKSGGKITESEVVKTADKISDDDMCYVLIYNPKIYDEYNEDDDKSILNTGDFGNQIDVDSLRGDGLEEGEEPTYSSISQGTLNSQIPWDNIDLEGNRGDTLGVDYEVGDEKEFYCYTTSNMETRKLEEFECVYAGDYCYIWSNGDADPDDLEEYGEEFDEEIYEEVVEAFGEPRFVGKSGKVNLMFYPMMSNLCGCFCMLDLFATGEVTEREIERYGVNTNHAMVHINSKLVSMRGAKELIYGTMAHEFQHLICGTDYFSTYGDGISCRTWLNEAMSGYIEEALYSGSKETAGHYKSFLESKLIRNGQSMYNFSTTSRDIGVYGSVYYFSEYLANLAGTKVFSKIHEYWRDSYSKTLCEAEAIVNSVSKSVKNKIEKTVTYPKTLKFDNDDEEWMSKLVLDFYLDMLSNKSKISAFGNIEPDELLYDDIDGADIEGGGRLIIAVKDTTFEIPEDADDGLIYIGLDKNFKPVTDYVYK